MGPTKAVINHDHLIHNLRLIQQAVTPAKVMGVVKADAYGHGSVEIARTLIGNNVDFLGVAFPEEGIALRQAGIDTPILVFGAQLSEFFEDHLRHNLDITLANEQQIDPLRRLCRKLKRKARVHIKIDTGMHRVGFLPDIDRRSIEKILHEEWFDVVGVYSHLSSADEEDLTFTLKQIDEFHKIKEFIESHTNKKALFHLANSAAIMRLPQACFDLVRPGVMLYGNPPGPDFPLNWDLKEVMRFVSQVTSIKQLGPGEPVSYNRRYHTKETTHIAIVPVGYADGYNRRMTNTGQALIRGKRFPIVGTVCMDQLLVDIGLENNVQIGDEVVLFGRQGNEHISIIDISRRLQTIPYEVTCWISNRVPRVHVQREKQQ